MVPRHIFEKYNTVNPSPVKPLFLGSHSYILILAKLPPKTRGLKEKITRNEPKLHFGDSSFLYIGTAQRQYSIESYFCDLIGFDRVCQYIRRGRPPCQFRVYVRYLFTDYKKSFLSPNVNQRKVSKGVECRTQRIKAHAC